MKTDKTLEQKLNKAEAKMPGVLEQLKPYKGGICEMYWTGSPEDVEYIETEKYQITAAKWESHTWSEYFGGIQWEEWLTLHYKEKGSKNEIKTLETPKIVTRDAHKPEKDREALWPYNYVGVKALDPTKIEAAWVDKEGKKGPTYELSL